MDPFLNPVALEVMTKKYENITFKCHLSYKVFQGIIAHRSSNFAYKIKSIKAN